MQSTTCHLFSFQAGATEPASPGRRRSGPLGGQEATRSERPWGPLLATPPHHVEELMIILGRLHVFKHQLH